jgi:hypothetical protein
VKQGLFISMNSFIFRKEAIQDWPEWYSEVRRGTHTGFLLIVTSKGYNYHFMEVMGVKRRNPGGITESEWWKKSSKSKHRIFLYEKLREYFDYKKDDVLIPVLLKWYRKRLLENLLQFDVKDLRKNLKKYIQYCLLLPKLKKQSKN